MTQPKSMGGLGFKDFELFNLAMLARQVWRLLQDPDSLNARILKSVYFPNTTILDATRGSHPSQIWRALIEGRDTLKLGIIKRIGNGESTNIWNDNWLPRPEMMRPYGCIAGTPPVLVSELIDHTSATWIKHIIDSTFLAFDAKVVLGIPLCTTAMPVQVRSAYNMLVATRQRREAWLEGSAGSSTTLIDGSSWKTL